MATQTRKPAAGSVEVALLADTNIEGVRYPAGAVVRLSEELAKAHAASGEVDPAEAAIEARKAAGAEVFTHLRPAVDPAA